MLIFWRVDIALVIGVILALTTTSGEYTMDASAYYEMHKAIESIVKLIRHEMYQGDRGGAIPPEAIAQVADEIRMQVTWLDIAEKRPRE